MHIWEAITTTSISTISAGIQRVLIMQEILLIHSEQPSLKIKTCTADQDWKTSSIENILHCQQIDKTEDRVGQAEPKIQAINPYFLLKIRRSDSTGIFLPWGIFSIILTNLSTQGRSANMLLSTKIHNYKNCLIRLYRFHKSGRSWLTDLRICSKPAELVKDNGSHRII